MDPTVGFEYDGEKNILFTEDAGDIQTREEVDAFFDQYESYLNQLGKKCALQAQAVNGYDKCFIPVRIDIRRGISERFNIKRGHIQNYLIL